jgi:hypothetical protein
MGNSSEWRGVSNRLGAYSISGVDGPFGWKTWRLELVTYHGCWERT